MLRSAIAFENTYAEMLPGMSVAWSPAKVPHPTLLRFNHALAGELGLDATELDSPVGAAIFAGNDVPPGATPVAQAYAGHQFGGFSAQLGDGRALLLGEVIDRNGQRRDIAFKGSGRTPFSRGGDGKSALGPALREYILGEAMYAFGIPTTRALAVVSTGETVIRETGLPGGVLTRVAASHIRVGTFQYFAARGDAARVAQLAEYVIQRHYPELADQPDRYFALYQSVAKRQAALIAQWMNIGFIHGVMNTDNMAVSGETIDYGPCAFLEAYDPLTVFSSIDTHGRYAYGNQPGIARWNLARFAETLLPLIDPDDTARAADRAMTVINAFPDWYEAHRLNGARAKLGITTPDAGDAALHTDWLALLEAQQVDFTLAWRHLADAAEGNLAPLRLLFADPAPLQDWLARWQPRLTDGAAARIRRVNPIYIPRNERVEEALSAAVNDADLKPFNQLLEALAQPYDSRPGFERFAQPAPADVTARYQTFCGT
jgi:serine/tyrosine/threonine adenylyltransferase